MCGIAFVLGGEKERALAFAERANRLLAHRGPDGQGIFQEEQLVLAHRRLAILDLSEAGAQPMYSRDERYVIVYNGEIYNHLQLRQQFLPQFQFRGQSDTETLLVLYAHFKEEMLHHLVGMWAFAIWDTVEKSIFVCRDRYGQKPLYYRVGSDNSLRFASEIKPLLEENEHPLMNETAVVEYLAIGNYGHLGNQTFFKEVFSFRQGHYAKIKIDGRNIQEIPYWRLPQISPKEKITFDLQQKKQLKETIEESVRSQLLSDVQVGATLSGGLDSSIVIGAIAQASENSIPVFTAQSKESKWDESVYVKAVEAKWETGKINVSWKELNQTGIADHLSHFISIQEEPFGDPSIIAHGFLIAMAKENKVKVILGGQGADELFFGYENMTSALLTQGIRKGQWTWVKNNLTGKRLSISGTTRIIIGAISPWLERTIRKKSRRNKRSFISNRLLCKVDENQIKLADISNFYSIWDESIYRVHLPHLLHYDDRNSMSYSIEGRMPFLDHRIAERISYIRTKDFFEAGESKSMLRQACAHLLPEQVLKRKDKIGFYTPLHDMLKKEILWIEKTLISFNEIDKFVLPEVWKSDVAFFKGDGESIEKALRLWRILSFVIWMQVFRIDTTHV